MTLNNSEFDDIRRNQDPDEPIDGRDGQPASEGSSDVPHTLENEDSLRGVDSILAEHDALEFEGADLEGADADRTVEDTLAGEEQNPGIDQEREVPLGDRRDDPDQT